MIIMKSNKTLLICLLDPSLQASMAEKASHFGWMPQAVSELPSKEQMGKILPDVFLIDAAWIGETGHSYLREIQEDFPSIWIYILADSSVSEEILFQGLKSGARGWCFKQEPDKVLEELKNFCEEGIFFKPSVSQFILREFKTFPSGEPLLSVEEELLKSGSSGLSLSQIQKKLNLSKKFLKSHWENIWQKLNINAKAKSELEEFEREKIEQPMNPKQVEESKSMDKEDAEEAVVEPISSLKQPPLRSQETFFSEPQDREKKTDKAETFQFVTFQIGKEEFAMRITDLQEIQRLLPITSVPKVSSYVKGIVNLRGRIIPILDLRKKLGFEPKEQTKEARIMVISDQESREVIGMIVDSVKEVLRIPSDLIQPPPSLIQRKEGDYIQGVVNLEERLILLVDTKKIISVPQSELDFSEK